MKNGGNTDSPVLNELELGLIQKPHMAQKSVLRGEVDARASQAVGGWSLPQLRTQHLNPRMLIALYYISKEFVARGSWQPGGLIHGQVAPDWFRGAVQG